MIRWYPMARATSLLGGNPIIYDLTQIASLTRCVPAYPPIVRDVETIHRSLRRKNFGSRPTVDLGFEIIHSRTQNTAARYELIGGNLLQDPDDLTAAPWSATNLTVTRPGIATPDPEGTGNATRLADSSGAAIGVILQNCGGQPDGVASGKTGLFSLFLRADTAHVCSIGIQDNGSQATDLDVDAESVWTRQQVSMTFPAGSGNFQVMIRATQLVVAQTGTIDIYRCTLQHIIPQTGTDEQILADLEDKFGSDDWTVALTLDGGLTWRNVLLQQITKAPVADKWIGHAIDFSLECSDPILTRPAVLDGRW